MIPEDNNRGLPQFSPAGAEGRRLPLDCRRLRPAAASTRDYRGDILPASGDPPVSQRPNLDVLPGCRSVWTAPSSF